MKLSERAASIRDFFVSRIKGFIEFVRNARKKFSDLSDDFVTEAKKDMEDALSRIKELWTFDENISSAIKLVAISSNLLITPITLIVAILIASARIILATVLSVLILDVYKAYTLIKNAVLYLYENVLVHVLPALKKCVNYVINTIVQTLTKIKDKFVDFVEAVITHIKSLVTFVKDLFSKAAKYIWNALKSAAEAVWNALKTVWNALKSAAEAVWNALKTVWNALKSAAEAVWNALKTVWNALKSAAEAVWKAIKSVMKNVWRAVKNTVKALWSARHLAKGVAKSIVNLVEGATLAVGALFFETGVDKAISGIAKSIYHLEEGLAAAVGSILDGLATCKRELSSIFFTQQEPKKEDRNYYSQAGINAVKAFNDNVVDATGNSIVHAYKSMKDHWYGTKPEQVDANVADAQMVVRSNRSLSI